MTMAFHVGRTKWLLVRQPTGRLPRIDPVSKVAFTRTVFAFVGMHPTIRAVPASPITICNWIPAMGLRRCGTDPTRSLFVINWYRERRTTFASRAAIRLSRVSFLKRWLSSLNRSVLLCVPLRDSTANRAPTVSNSNGVPYNSLKY